MKENIQNVFLESEAKLIKSEQINKEFVEARMRRKDKERAKEREKKEKIAEQQKFYQNLASGLESGQLQPVDVFEYEDIAVPSPEEISKMNSDDFRLLEERTKLAEGLTETRQRLEKKELENAVADQIIAERGTNIGKKMREMTPAERMEFEKRANKIL